MSWSAPIQGRHASMPRDESVSAGLDKLLSRSASRSLPVDRSAVPSSSEPEPPPPPLPAPLPPDASIDGGRAGGRLPRMVHQAAAAGQKAGRAAARLARRAPELPHWAAAFAKSLYKQASSDSHRRQAIERQYQRLRAQHERILISPEVVERVDGGHIVRELLCERSINLSDEALGEVEDTKAEERKRKLEGFSPQSILSWDKKGESEVLIHGRDGVDLAASGLDGHVDPWTGEAYRPVVANMTVVEPGDDGVRVLKRALYTVLPNDQMASNTSSDGRIDLESLADAKKAYRQAKKVAHLSKGARTKAWLVNPLDLGRVTIRKADPGEGSGGEQAGRHAQTVGNVGSGLGWIALAASGAPTAATSVAALSAGQASTVGAAAQKFENLEGQGRTLARMARGEPAALTYDQRVQENRNARLASWATIVTGIPGAAVTVGGLVASSGAAAVLLPLGQGMLGASGLTHGGAHLVTHKKPLFDSLQRDIDQRLRHDRQLQGAQSDLAMHGVNPHADPGHADLACAVGEMLVEKYGETVANEAVAFDHLARKLSDRGFLPTADGHNVTSALDYFIDLAFDVSRQKGRVASIGEKLRGQMTASTDRDVEGLINDVDELGGWKTLEFSDVLLLIFKKTLPELHDLCANDVRKSTLGTEEKTLDDPTAGALSKGWRRAVDRFLSAQMAKLENRPTDGQKETLKRQLVGALTQHPDLIAGLARALEGRDLTLAEEFQGPFFSYANYDFFTRIGDTESQIRGRFPGHERYEGYCHDLVTRHLRHHGLIAGEDEGAKPSGKARREAFRIVRDVAAEHKRTRGYLSSAFSIGIAHRLHAFGTMHCQSPQGEERLGDADFQANEGLPGEVAKRYLGAAAHLAHAPVARPPAASLARSSHFHGLDEIVEVPSLAEGLGGASMARSLAEPSPWMPQAGGPSGNVTGPAAVLRHREDAGDSHLNRGNALTPRTREHIEQFVRETGRPLPSKTGSTPLNAAATPFPAATWRSSSMPLPNRAGSSAAVAGETAFETTSSLPEVEPAARSPEAGRTEPASASLGRSASDQAHRPALSRSAPLPDRPPAPSKRSSSAPLGGGPSLSDSMNPHLQLHLQQAWPANQRPDGGERSASETPSSTYASPTASPAPEPSQVDLGAWPLQGTRTRHIWESPTVSPTSESSQGSPILWPDRESLLVPPGFEPSENDARQPRPQVPRHIWKPPSTAG